MGIITVISNTFLIFFSSHSYTDVFSNDFKVSETIDLLWILIASEHFILIVKAFLIVLIKDRPSWVDKSQQKLKVLMEDINQEQDRLKVTEKAQKQAEEEY